MTYFSIHVHSGKKPTGDVYEIVQVSSIMLNIKEFPKQFADLERQIAEAKANLSKQKVKNE